MAGNGGGNKILQAFFVPAAVLMGRLNVAGKFVLLGLMSLAAVMVVIYSLFASLDGDIEFLQRELKGLDLVKPFPRAVQILQQHRGLSAGILGGDGDMWNSRAAAEMEAARALNEIEGIPLADAALGGSLRQIEAEWERLRREGLGWTAAENFAVHTRLIGRMQEFEAAVADEYALILDPELDTYYLIDTVVNKLPHALEHLGQLRAYGTGVLAGKQVSAQQRAEMNILIVELDEAIGLLRTNLDKTGRYNPALEVMTSEVSRDIAEAARQVSALVASDILTGHFTTSPGDFFEVSTAAIDRSYSQVYETLLPMTEMLLKARVEKAERVLHASIGIASLLFLVVAYFSIGTCRAITLNIRSLSRSAYAFAGGNLAERVNLGAHDELGQVGDSFNEMAFGFRTLLEASRENEARLRDLSVRLEERVRERTLELEKAQKETEALLRRNQALMLTSMDGIHVMDMRGNIVAANDAFCRMLGYSRDEAAGLNAADWDAQWTAEELRGKFRELIGGSAMFETLWRRKDGALVNAEISASGVEIEGQGFIFASSRDITERKRAEAVLRRHKVVIDAAMDGFWMTDAEGVLQEVNEAYARMSGYSVGELVGMHISQLEAKEQSVEEVRAHIAKVIAQGHDRFETRHRHRDGHEIDIEVSATYMAESRQLFVFCRDITERKKAEAEIRNLAFYDALTGLANRRLFLDRLGAALPVSARYSNYGAVLFLDLDRFKALNDTLGHEYGDLLLVEVAVRVKSCVREIDTVARLGGDEFVVLIEEVGEERDEALRKVGLVAEKIREALGRPYRLREHEYQCSPSIGVALYHGNGETVDMLLRHADMAMYQAKSSGRNRVSFYDPAAPQAEHS